MAEVKDEVTKNCVQCGKPGGRVVIDPYVLELYDERVKVRLHDSCAQARVDET